MEDNPDNCTTDTIPIPLLDVERKTVSAIWHNYTLAFQLYKMILSLTNHHLLIKGNGNETISDGLFSSVEE